MITVPIVSVIMPSYNSEKWILESIKSALNQTLSEIEILIVDDASSDSTVSIVKSIQKTDHRIKLIELKKNLGVANARNLGMSRAVGKYVAFLDADDCWNKNKLKIQVDYMVAHRCEFSYCDYLLINDKNKVTGKRIISNSRLTHQDLLYGNKIGLLTVMVSSEIAKKFSFPNIHHEDYACWLAITNDGIVAQKCSMEVLASYRKYSSSLTANKIKSALWTWNVYKNFEGANIVKSLLYFFRYVFMAIFNRR